MMSCRTQHPLYALLKIPLLALLALQVALAQAATPALVENWKALDPALGGVVMDTDGKDNVFALGYTNAGDFLVTKKFSPNGALLWSATYDPAERVRGSWIATDPTGNVLVTGYRIVGSNPDAVAFLTLKYDPLGNLLWTDAIPGQRALTARVATDAVGNVYVAGSMSLVNASGYVTDDVVVVKYSPQGDRLWLKSFPSSIPSSMDGPHSLAVSADGSRVAVAGRGGNFFLVAVWDGDGNLVGSSQRQDLLPANDLAFGPAGVLYVGATSWTVQASYAMAIVKFDADMNTLWTRTYPAGDTVYRIAVDNAGNVVATGTDSAGYLDWVTLKADADGALLWSRRYDGHRVNNEIPYSLAIGADNAVYVAGQGGPGPAGTLTSTLSMVAVKYGADGTPKWSRATESGAATSLRLGALNRVFLFGQAQMATIGYTQTGASDPLPAAPDGLMSRLRTVGSTTSVVLNWADNSDNEFGFRVERCAGSGCSDFSEIGRTLMANETSYEDRGAQAGTTYLYRVLAYGFMGDSAPSNTATQTTAAAAQALPPSAPSGLTAKTVSRSQIGLAWVNTSTTQTGVAIERCKPARKSSSCTAFAEVARVQGTASSFVDGGLSRATTYYYRVRSFNVNGMSAYSNVAIAKTSR